MPPQARQRAQQNPSADDDAAATQFVGLPSCKVSLARSRHSVITSEGSSSARARCQGDEDQVVQVANDRDEIGDEVDGAESIGDHDAAKRRAYQGTRGSLYAR